MIKILEDRWRQSGVKEGDTLLLHSNIRRTLFEFRRKGFNIKTEDILNSFLSAVGPKGTLLIPVFNFSFAGGKPFDIRNTPSEMGALTEVARNNSRAVRTGHPVYSFVAIGFNSHMFKGVDNTSAYSDDSPFGILKKMNGKIASLDLDDQCSMTFYHHVEEVKNVFYRFLKEFRGCYYDINGNCQERTYEIFVRNLELGVLTDVNNAGDLMWDKGLYQGDRPNIGSGLRVIKAQEMFNFVSSLIDSGKTLGYLYSLQENVK